MAAGDKRETRGTIRNYYPAVSPNQTYTVHIAPETGGALIRLYGDRAQDVLRVGAVVSVTATTIRPGPPRRERG